MVRELYSHLTHYTDDSPLFKNDFEAAGAESPRTDGLLAPAARGAHAQEAQVIFPLPQINDKNRRRQVPGFAFKNLLGQSRAMQQPELEMWISLSSEPQHILHHPHLGEFQRGNNQRQALAVISAVQGFSASSLPLKNTPVILDERAGAQST